MKLRTGQPLVMPDMVRRDDPAYELERYSPRQAAMYLGLSVASVYREIAFERIAHRRNGERGEVSMSQADLDQWREARRRPARLTVVRTRGVGKSDESVTPLRLPAKRRFA